MPKTSEIQKPPNMISLTPTKIAAYVRLQSCDKYLKYLAEEKKNGQDQQSVNSSLNEQETAFEKKLQTLNFKKGKGDILKCTESGNFYASQYKISPNEVEGVTLNGTIDFILKIGDTFTIVECKSSDQDKVYQRVQAAVYSLMLGNKPHNVMVVRRKRTGELHEYEIKDNMLCLKSDSNISDKDDQTSDKSYTEEIEQDDDEELTALQTDFESIYNPHIDETELKALQTDIKRIIKRVKSTDIGKGFRLFARCDSCEHKEKCLKEAIQRAKGENGQFGTELLTYGVEAKARLGKCKSLKDVEKSKAPLHPPPAQLVPVRSAYYLENKKRSQILPIPNRVPDLPFPSNGDPFVQIFITPELDPNDPNSVTEIGMKVVYHNIKKQNPTTIKGDLKTAIEQLKTAIKQLKTALPEKNFKAHFYFWSLEEKLKIAGTCRRLISGTKKAKDKNLLQNFLAWISRHEYLQKHDSAEEMVATCLLTELQKCFAIGCIGTSIREIANLRGMPNACRNSNEMRETITFVDPNEPCLKNKLELMQRIEGYARNPTNDKEQSNYLNDIFIYKYLNPSNPLCAPPPEPDLRKDLRKAAANMQMIEIMHKRDVWLKKITCHIDRLLESGEAVELMNPSMNGKFVGWIKLNDKPQLNDIENHINQARCATNIATLLDSNINKAILEQIKATKDRLSLGTGTRIVPVGDKPPQDFPETIPYIGARIIKEETFTSSYVCWKWRKISEGKPNGDYYAKNLFPVFDPETKSKDDNANNWRYDQDNSIMSYWYDPEKNAVLVKATPRYFKEDDPIYYPSACVKDETIPDEQQNTVSRVVDHKKHYIITRNFTLVNEHTFWKHLTDGIQNNAPQQAQ